jgi:hypothetical protein
MNEFMATFHFVEVDQSEERARQEALRENSTRPAVAEMAYISTGVGQMRVNAPLIFPVVFRNEPHLATGSGVASNPKPKLWHDPIGHCGVTAWKRNGRGYFTGAWIWTRVEVYPIGDILDAGGLVITNPTPPAVKVQHFLTFSGTAHKDLSLTLPDDLNPRTPGV